MQFITSQRGKQHLCLDGYRYREKNTLKNGNTNWRCLVESCKAVVQLSITNEIARKTDHNHVASPSKIEAKKFVQQIREKALTSNEMPRQIILSSQVQLPVFAAPTIPSYQCSLRTINRKRQGAQVSIPKPKTLSELGDLPSPLTVTCDGQNFLYFDSGKSDERILVFATLPAIDLLNGRSTWHCDGTFSVSPDVFYQVYTIHGVIEDTLIPLVYALLSNKSQATYTKLFSCFDQVAEKLHLDFELAVRNAAKEISPNTSIHFCFFHLSQAVWRKVQNLGYQKVYADDEHFRLSVKKLLCLAFLPTEDVPAGLDLLREENSYENFQEVADYFEDTYVGPWRGSRRVKPKFELKEWNLYERVLNHEARTNNALEGWNGNFNKFVSVKHPSIPKLIQKFKEEQKNAEINVERIMAGETIRQKKRNVEKANKRLFDVVESYKKDNILTYLKACTYSLCI